MPGKHDVAYKFGKPVTKHEFKELIHEQIVMKASEVGAVVPISILTADINNPIRAVILRGRQSSMLTIYLPAGSENLLVAEIENGTHFKKGLYLEDGILPGERSYNVSMADPHWKALSAHLVDIAFNLNACIFGIGDKADFTCNPSPALMKELMGEALDNL